MNQYMIVHLPAEGIDYYKTMKEIQMGLIRKALDRTGGNKTHAAGLLGLQRTTLVEMMRTNGMPLNYEKRGRRRKCDKSIKSA